MSLAKMLRRLFAFLIAVVIFSGSQLAIASTPSSAIPNSVRVPGKILQVTIDLHSSNMSPEAVALGQQLGLNEILQKIQSLRAQLKNPGNSADSDTAGIRLALSEARQEAVEIITQTDLEVDFVEAQILEEQSLYADMLQHMTAERDRAVAITNAVSFGTNGALWAACEAIAIPTYKAPILSIPSGVLGVLAGVIPSFASFYAMRQVSGKKYSYKEEPNMLSKLFDRPVGLHCEYPDSVWNFLSAVPANEASGKRRVDLIIDRWIEDNNMPSFNSKSSERQVDLVTGSKSIPKTITIDLLSTRQTMLDQLSSEVLKMKRLLLELMLAVRGTKQI